MRKCFENNNYLEKEVVLNIRVPKNFDEDMERRIDEALADVLFDLGCELVDSKEYRDVVVPDIHDVDADKLSFRYYDDTELPVQFFFGYEVSIEETQKLASIWGCKGELCRDIEVVFDLLSPKECPVEAVLTFYDNDQRWVDLRSTGNQLTQLKVLLEHACTGRALEALQIYKEISEEHVSSLPKDSLSSQIETAAAHAENRHKAAERDVNSSSPQR